MRRVLGWTPELMGMMIIVLLVALLFANVYTEPPEPEDPPCYAGQLRESPAGWVVLLKPLRCP